MAWDAVWITILQGLLYVAVAPGVLGLLRQVEARLAGRHGPRPYQPYLDLWKLFGRQSVIPETASWVFAAAPFIVFGCYAFLGLIVPIVFLPATVGTGAHFFVWPRADLLTIVYVLGLARFVIGLAGMDSGAPFAGLGSGREMFMHVLAEPTLIFVVYALALNAHTTSLPGIMRYGLDFEKLYGNLGVWLALLALAGVALAETGRLPFDNPATHLELTMMGQAIHLEYAGPQLALLEWAEALRLTFFLTLVANLFFPYFLPAYPLKLLVLVILLAVWEMTWARLRLRATVGPATLSLALAVLSVVVVVLSRSFND